MKQEMDKLVQEDIALAKELARVQKSKDARVIYHMQVMREDVEPLDNEIIFMRERRRELRGRVLELWEKLGAPGSIMELPSAKITRRNFRELVVHDKDALIDALDREGRLDLVDYKLDEKAIAHLIEKGKLPDMPEGAAEVKCNYQLTVRVKKAEPVPVDEKTETLIEDDNDAT